jgi:hypothetical protein
MRLLQVSPEGFFSLTTFLPSKIPSRYAILSHTWEPDDQEVTFKDLMNGEGISKTGYRKIMFCAEQAARDGIQYFWVDSCCNIQTHHRYEGPTKSAASAAENDGSRHPAFSIKLS